MGFSVDISDNTGNFERFIESLLDDTTMLRVNKMFAEKCDPYVPFNTGKLSQSGLNNVTPDSINYNVPYAKEQYYGVGIRHNLEHHPRATAYWDKVMMSEKGEEVAQEVAEILQRRAQELYGE